MRVSSSSVALETDGQAETGGAVPVAGDAPPGEAHRHLAVGIAALPALDVLGLDLLKGAGHQFPVGHMEIHRTVQPSTALCQAVEAADHQEDHDHQQHKAVQPLPFYQAPEEHRQPGNKDDAVDEVLPGPKVLQSIHTHSPSCRSTALILSQTGALCKGNPRRGAISPCIRRNIWYNHVR